MDWNLAIEKNREALKRVLALIVAMIASTRDDAPAQGGGAATLPRHLHRFVLRLLRPAEAAVRRLIIVAARGLVVTLPPPRPRKPKPPSIFVRDGVGTGVVRVGSLLARIIAKPRPASLSLPLFDPHKRFGARRRVKQRSVPRITFDFDRRREPAPPPPTPDDPLDARRLHRRLEAVASALDDLPRQAKRLARWRARRDAAIEQSRDPNPDGEQETIRFRRLEPMRPGRPPGWRRRPDHPVDEVLNELHGLALWARERLDTS